jgi:hypothetical protein
MDLILIFVTIFDMTSLVGFYFIDSIKVGYEEY